jgi:hypothetical protein
MFGQCKDLWKLFLEKRDGFSSGVFDKRNEKNTILPALTAARKHGETGNGVPPPTYPFL